MLICALKAISKKSGKQDSQKRDNVQADRRLSNYTGYNIKAALRTWQVSLGGVMAKQHVYNEAGGEIVAGRRRVTGVISPSDQVHCKITRGTEYRGEMQSYWQKQSSNDASRRPQDSLIFWTMAR